MSPSLYDAGGLAMQSSQAPCESVYATASPLTDSRKWPPPIGVPVAFVSTAEGPAPARAATSGKRRFVGDPEIAKGGYNSGEFGALRPIGQ